MTHTKEKVKYCSVEQEYWMDYPEFDTKEEAYKFKEEMEAADPMLYILEPIRVKVYYER
jgi:hypothetical protein